MRSTGVVVKELPKEAAEIRRRCGNLPLALALCGALAKGGIAWNSVLRRLEQATFERVRDPHPDPDDPQNETLDAALKVSVEALSTAERDRFVELSVLLPDVEIPPPVARIMWAHTGALKEDECELGSSRAKRD